MTKKNLKNLAYRCFFFNASLLLNSIIFQVKCRKIFFFASLMVKLNKLDIFSSASFLVSLSTSGQGKSGAQLVPGITHKCYTCLKNFAREDHSAHFSLPLVRKEKYFSTLAPVCFSVDAWKRSI
jgi:hypothetical protein